MRTDPQAKKQQGITYLLMDMQTPGITVRPIITLDGHHETNEMFLDNVRVPVANRVGEENKGWDYAKYLLGHERSGIARVGVSKMRRAAGRANSQRRVAVGGATADADDPRFQERVAALEVELKALEITQMRVIAETARAQRRQARPEGVDPEDQGLGAAAGRDGAAAGGRRLRRDASSIGDFVRGLTRRRRRRRLGARHRTQPLLGPPRLDRRRLERDPAQHPREDRARPLRSKPWTST